MAIRVGTEEEAGGVEGMKALITAYRGNLAAIARHLRVHRTSVFRVIDKYPELKDYLGQERQAIFDDIENGLIQSALDGNVLSMMFYLKTQGHLIGRPYQERPRENELERHSDAPQSLEEWTVKQETRRKQVFAMLEDFSTIDGEAEQVG